LLDDKGTTALMVISHFLDDPVINQAGFQLMQRNWSLLNCFHALQSHCRDAGDQLVADHSPEQINVLV